MNANRTLRVLLIQDLIPRYRIPIFDQVAARPGLHLTVVHALDQRVHGPTAFDLSAYSARRGRVIVRTDLHRHVDFNSFDVIIASFNLRRPDIVSLALKSNRRFGLILWGIGVSCSKGYATHTALDGIRTYIARKADVLMLYSSHARPIYLNAGIAEERIVVAENTVHVPDPCPCGPNGSQSTLLFLGSLRKNKGIDELIRAYSIARRAFTRPIDLEILGDGESRAELEALVSRLGLADFIHFRGEIYGLEDQRRYFSRSVACISPTQAGLSVLLSMAHGVPFVTRSDAITGGERFNIKSGENGIEYRGGADELASHLVRLVNERDSTIIMGMNALDTYVSTATSTHMVDSFHHAIVQAAGRRGLS